MLMIEFGGRSGGVGRFIEDVAGGRGGTCSSEADMKRKEHIMTCYPIKSHAMQCNPMART